LYKQLKHNNYQLIKCTRRASSYHTRGRGARGARGEGQQEARGGRRGILPHEEGEWGPPPFSSYDDGERGREGG